MCKSAAEGGQRCASHAKKTLDTARANRKDKNAVWVSAKEFTDSARDTDGEDSLKAMRAKARSDQACREFWKADREWCSALAGYASTTEGETRMRERSAEAGLPAHKQRLFTTALADGAHQRARSVLVASGMAYADVDALSREEVEQRAQTAKPLKVPKGTQRVMVQSGGRELAHVLVTKRSEPHWSGEGGEAWTVTDLHGASLGEIERYTQARHYSYGGGSRLGYSGAPRVNWAGRAVGGPGRDSAAKDTRNEALEYVVKSHQAAARTEPAPATAAR